MSYGPIQPRRARIALIGAVAAAAGLIVSSGSVAAKYPPEPSVTANAATTVCHDEVPYIHYSVQPQGVESANDTATITILNSKGAIVAGPTSGLELAGQILYPGVQVDSAGNVVDWPGWTWSNSGWVPNPNEAQLEKDLQLRISVNPEVIVPVSYPPETDACLSLGVSPAAGATGGGTLPTTGTSDTARIVWIATGTLLAGLVVTAASFRRRGATVSSS